MRTTSRSATGSTNGPTRSGLANLTDWFIGLPLAIAGLVGLGLVIRFVLHRLVDRLVSRAEDGVLPARVSRFGRRRRPEDQTHTQELRDLAAATRRVQRAKTMGDLLKSVITGVLVAIFGTMILEPARRQHRPDHRQRRDPRHRARLRCPVAGEGLPLRGLHDLRGPVRRRRRRRRRRGHRHRRGGQPAGHPAARPRRHGLVRPQRRDPSRRQQEPELVPSGGRHRCRLRRGPRPRQAGAGRGRARHVGGRGLPQRDRRSSRR